MEDFPLEIQREILSWLGALLPLAMCVSRTWRELGNTLPNSLCGCGHRGRGFPVRALAGSEELFLWALEFFGSRGLKNSRVLALVAGKGSRELLRRLLGEGWPFDEGVLLEALEGDRVEQLPLLLPLFTPSPIPWFHVAAEAGSLRVLKNLTSRFPELWKSYRVKLGVYNRALRGEQKEVLAWVTEQEELFASQETFSNSLGFWERF